MKPPAATGRSGSRRVKPVMNTIAGLSWLARLQRRPLRPLLRWLAVAVAVAAPAAGHAFELPAGVPARAQGLWLIERSGTVGDGQAITHTQKIWQACLDARADRALHELEAREQQASVAGLGQQCDEPRPALSGKTLSWTMHCSAVSPVEDQARTTEVQHTTTFLDADRTRAETVIASRHNGVSRQGRVLIHMQRAGACAPGLAPGDTMLMHWRINGEETLKSRQIRNIHGEIAQHKAYTASKPGR